MITEVTTITPPRMTNKFRISRYITAAAVLLTDDMEEINEAVLSRTAYLIEQIWRFQFIEFTHKYQVTDFWKRVAVQAGKSPDIGALKISWTGDNSSCKVQILVKTETGKVFHQIDIEARR